MWTLGEIIWYGGWTDVGKLNVNLCIILLKVLEKCIKI